MLILLYPLFFLTFCVFDLLPEIYNKVVVGLVFFKGEGGEGVGLIFGWTDFDIVNLFLPGCPPTLVFVIFHMAHYIARQRQYVFTSLLAAFRRWRTSLS